MSEPNDIINTQYKRNALGHLVPVEQIKEVDLIRDDLVDRIIKNARHLQAAMKDFKARTLTEIDSFIDLSASEYLTQFGGAKGNITLSSYDGKFRVQIKNQTYIAFDERLQVAKTLIDELIHEWTKDSRGEIKALIEHAFQTDKEGNINKGRVFSLFRLKIDDPKWLRAMDAIRDSMQASHSKEYLGLYERVGDEDKYVRISLDMAGL
ncbi:DUF3164 family protein [Methylomicrobium sp. Wu6]|uniref:DUF3164 family protein n=1 Tax=Methylomicrobium sp. Wu6 TaxID=3107928 RepID=UPI002DD645DA|nr:DUF3164 family protein [Methylomicrobium sp. Wu6]MEC4750021.1 DUF3164 family protein [Methylomicrobium sp. Wu6]